MTDYTYSHLYAREMHERLLLADRMKGGAKKYHAQAARQQLIKLLHGKVITQLGQGGPTSAEMAQAEVLDLIENAIVDSTDIDTTPAIQARAVLNALLNSAAPMPEEDEA